MSIKKELNKIFSLAWPLLIAQVTQTLMGVSDTIMAGRFSPTDMAAVAIGFSITMPVLFFIQGLVLALPPLISRYNGSNQFDKVANTTQQTFYLVFVVAILAVTASAWIPNLFALVEMEPELRRITVEYVQFILYSAPAFTLYQVLRNYAEGLSVTKPTMIIMVIGLLVNIPANYVLIYGKLGFPAYGGVGCGIATAIVFVAMFIATLIYVICSKKLAKYQLFKIFYFPDLKMMRKTLDLGLPIAMTILFEVTLFGVVALLLSPLGSTIVASHQVALNFSSIMFMFPLSIGMATSIRVSHLLGENDCEGAKQAVKGAMILGLSIACFTGLATVIASQQIPYLYTKDLYVIELAASLMMLAAMFQLSDAVQVISAGALRGYKDTKAMFYITFVSYWLVGLPIGCILALTNWLVEPLGAAGFWIGFICGLSTAAILLWLRLTKTQAQIETMME